MHILGLIFFGLFWWWVACDIEDSLVETFGNERETYYPSVTKSAPKPVVPKAKPVAQVEEQPQWDRFDRWYRKQMGITHDDI